ncbi:protein IWS1 homolog, partial [Patella vulgata]|uniref:protein IWS1 homolog n=1 Tax=Patella vulgata TaxID=6465 RepID=UPI0024A88447
DPPFKNVARNQNMCVSTKDVALTQNIDTPTKDVTPPQNIDTPTEDVAPPQDIDTPTKDVAPPQDMDTPTKDVAPSQNIDTPTEDVTSPQNIDTPTKDVTPPQNIDTPTEDVAPPQDIDTPTKDVAPPQDMDTPTKDVAPSQNIDTPTKDVTPTQNIDTPTKDVALTKDVTPTQNIGTTSTDISPAKDLRKGTLSLEETTSLLHDIIMDKLPELEDDIIVDKLPELEDDIIMDKLPELQDDIIMDKLPELQDDIIMDKLPEHEDDIIMDKLPELEDAIESTSGSEYQPSQSESSDGSDEEPEKKSSKIVEVLYPNCSESDDGSEIYPMLASSFKEIKTVVGSSKEVSSKEVSSNEVSSKEVSSQDSSSDESLDEDCIVREKSHPGIYISKLLKADTTKTGLKKINRVYNSYQYCGLCEEKVSNFAQHIERNKTKIEHANSAEVKEIHNETDKKQKDKLRTLLRGKFNNQYNMKTLQKGRGEIFLERRPSSSFSLHDYGPCPGCLFWMSKQLIRKHQKSCVAKAESHNIRPSSAHLLTQSDTISGRIQHIASSNLVKEVFQIMHMDAIGKVVREDSLIIQLGNQWMEKNVGNRLKRGSYTSQILRLVGRLLINLRNIKPLPAGEEQSLWNYLKPSHFDAIVEATLMTAAPDMDDEEDLKKPSNAVKLGFDIKRLLNGKIGLSIIREDKASRAHAEDLLKTMEVYWGTRVTKLSRVLLEQRHYNKDQQLPEPSDIEKLNRSLSDSIKSLDLTVQDFQNFIHVAEVISAKLVMYNRRRTGELQAIRLTDYKQRKKGQCAEHLLGQCSAFEKKLLESQEVMTVRGKVTFTVL